MFGDLDVTGTGVREDRSAQTRKRECGRDTWNADIPNRKMVLNHALFAFITRGGTVWSLLSFCIFVVVLNKIKSLDHSSRFTPLHNFSSHTKGIVTRGPGWPLEPIIILGISSVTRRTVLSPEAATGGLMC